MLEIIIQIKDDEEQFGYRKLIGGVYDTKNAYYLLPPFVQKCFDAWKESPNVVESHGDKLKGSLEILWEDYRFIFKDIYWD